jgi:predicted outer membrane repeat protein
LDNNKADSDDNGSGNGGGIYIFGQTLGASSLKIHQGLIKSNIAIKGGAIYLGGNVNNFMMLKNDFISSSGIDNCWSEKCSILKNNEAKQVGGAIYATGGVNYSRIEGTQIYENRANGGSVMSIDSTNTVTNFELFNNTIYHNGRSGTGGFTDNSVFDLYNNSSIFTNDNLSITMAFNTIVDNHVTVAAFVLNGVLNYLKVYSSILNDQSSNQIGQFNGSFNEVVFDCVNVNETTSIDMSYSTLTRMSADNPGFIIPNYDYHLKDNSALLDYCDNSATNPLVTPFNVDFVLEKDTDNDTRAIDILGINDFYGAYDLGSDESTGQNNSGIIFIDSFDW